MYSDSVPTAEVGQPVGDLSFVQTGLLLKHLLFFLGWVRVPGVCLMPGPQNLECLLGKSNGLGTAGLGASTHRTSTCRRSRQIWARVRDSVKNT